MGLAPLARTVARLHFLADELPVAPHLLLVLHPLPRLPRAELQRQLAVAVRAAHEKERARGGADGDERDPDGDDVGACGWGDLAAVEEGIWRQRPAPISRRALE